jgi:molybdate/tungstate transport system substrate-binding protein
MVRLRRRPQRAIALVASGVIACNGESPPLDARTAGADPRLVVYNAASIARPIRAALDSFAARTGVAYDQETAASLELARKMIDLGGQPDVVALADVAVFAELLMPAHARWYAVFGRNRIVLAYTTRSKFAGEINASNWREVVQRPGVEVGRADPNTDPSGYRTLLVFQLAERYYRETGLAARLLAAAPPRNVRPREADQVALLEVGELDYIWTYENLAKNAGLPYVTLPSETDLSAPQDSAVYATATVRVHGRTPRDSVTFRGSPILFAVTVPNGAPHRALAERFTAFLLSADGQRILRAQHFDAIGAPFAVGAELPASLRDAAAPR